jgi:hypothetical protein
MDLLSVSVVGDTASIVVNFDDAYNYTRRIKNLVVYTTAKVVKTDKGYYKVLSPMDFNKGFKQTLDWSFVDRTLNCVNSYFMGTYDEDHGISGGF